MKFLGYMLLTICVLAVLALFGCWAAAIWATAHVVGSHLADTAVMFFILALVSGVAGGSMVAEATYRNRRY